MSSKEQQHSSQPDPVSVILIAYNEAEVIEKEVEGFYREVVEKLPGSELIVAEDGSTDGTSEILFGLAERLPIRLIQGRERKGYKQALLDSLELAHFDWILFSDTGVKFYPHNFWELEKLRDRADLIIGVKKNRSDQYYRRIITKVFNFLVRSYFKIEVSDIDSGFRVFRREIGLRVAQERLFFNDLINSEMSLRMLALGARLAEIPVAYRLRQGKSRGLPLKRIPKVIIRTLFLFPRLKKEYKRLEAAQVDRN